MTTCQTKKRNKKINKKGIVSKAIPDCPACGKKAIKVKVCGVEQWGCDCGYAPEFK